MDFNRKAHPDCVYAQNPFHECASACLERIANGHVNKNTKKQTSKILSFSGSFGRKKKESHSQPHSPLPAKPYQNGGSGLLNAKPETKKNYKVFESKKTYSSSSSCDNDDFFNHKPEKKPSQTTQFSPHNLVDKSKPGNHKNNIEIEADNVTKVFSFLSPPRSHDDENNTEIGVELDLESVMSETLISVGKYRVRSGSSTILNTIISKHGDIAQNCTLESDSMRSRYLECLCSLMQELKSTPVNQLTKVKVKEMLAVVKDLESVNIEVAWLGSVLEEFGRFQEDVETEKERQEGLVIGKRVELEAQEANLTRMEEEVAVARLRVEEMRARIIEMEIEQSRMEKMGFKIEKFKGKLFLDELL